MRAGNNRFKILVIAALAFSCAAVLASAQNPEPVKQNAREKASPPAAGNNGAHSTAVDATDYSYEFSQPAFYIRHIVVEHDQSGKGKLTFEKLDGGDPITEPLELSDTARTRVLGLWETLKFLDSETNYQSERQYPHLGTIHLHMKRADRERDAEFNWTNDKTAFALANEYRNLANQIIFVFDIAVARQNQPLESPKLMDELDRLITRNELSDPQQLVPLLQDLATDERIPLIARNHATRILKKIQK